jgi:hypothetical protein
MKKPKDGIVVSNELFKEYHNFKNGKSFDKKKIMRLFHFYKREILTTIRQYREAEIELDNALKQQLAHNELRSQSLEELAAKYSVYKVILCTDKDEFPYVNIMNDHQRLENNFTASFDINENREFAILHLSAMCGKAESVFIYDSYFANNQNNVSLLKKILPSKRLDIEYYFGRDVDDANDIVRSLHDSCPDWTLHKATKLINNRHDRYLIIDDTVEIILSSGFEYLGDTRKEFTYIVRTIEESRFKHMIQR